MRCDVEVLQEEDCIGEPGLAVFREEADMSGPDFLIQSMHFLNELKKCRTH